MPENNSAIANLRRNLDGLLQESAAIYTSARSRKLLEAEIRIVMADLAKFLNELDPIRQPTSVFDPGNPKIVGRFISLALVAQHRQPLADVPSFYGSGVYAVYYKGKFDAYAPLSSTETPIYVGQAAPAVSNARTPLEQGDKLSTRLTEHAKNISKAVTTLSISDFEFRALVVQSGWETAAEDYLIHLFNPIWNNETQQIYGLGKHGDSSSTRSNKRSPWDTMHPGRRWAVDPKIPDAKSLSRIAKELNQHFIDKPVFKNMESLLFSFFEELKQV